METLSNNEKYKIRAHTLNNNFFATLFSFLMENNEKIEIDLYEKLVDMHVKHIKKLRELYDTIENEKYDVENIKFIFNNTNNTEFFQQPYYSDNNTCLHDNCIKCKGTGKNINTGELCIHMISCPCPKCTPR